MTRPAGSSAPKGANATLTAAREAVIAAARVWERNGREDRNVDGYTPEEETLEQAVYSLDRLEATDQAGTASPRAPEVQDAG